MEGMNILAWILIGAIAGFVADWLVKGINLGLIGKLIVGILGGFLGGWLLNDVLQVNLGGGFVNQVFSALIGAVLLLLILAIVRRRR